MSRLLAPASSSSSGNRREADRDPGSGPSHSARYSCRLPHRPNALLSAAAVRLQGQDGGWTLLQQHEGRPSVTRGYGRTTQAGIYFLDFDTYDLGPKPKPTELNNRPENALFCRLDNLKARDKSFARPGRYLVGVYGDNFVTRCNYTLEAVSAATAFSAVQVGIGCGGICTHTPCLWTCVAIHACLMPPPQGLREVEGLLLLKRSELQDLAADYEAAKQAWQAAVKRYESEAQALGELLVARSDAYASLMPQAAAQGLLAEMARSGQGEVPGEKAVGEALSRVVSSIRQGLLPTTASTSSSGSAAAAPVKPPAGERLREVGSKVQQGLSRGLQSARLGAQRVAGKVQQGIGAEAPPGAAVAGTTGSSSPAPVFKMVTDSLNQFGQVGERLHQGRAGRNRAPLWIVGWQERVNISLRCCSCCPRGSRRSPGVPGSCSSSSSRSTRLPCPGPLLPPRPQGQPRHPALQSHLPWRACGSARTARSKRTWQGVGRRRQLRPTSNF